MVSNDLLSQVLQALQNSKNFQFISPEKQNEFRAKLATFDQGQLQETLVALQEDQVARANYDAKKSENEQKKAAVAVNLKNQVREIEHQELKEKATQDAQTSEEEAEKMLSQQLNAIETSSKPPRKKFLGIF